MLWKDNINESIKFYHNGNEITHLKEYLTENSIIRIQNNSSVSIAIRTIKNMCGLLCGDTFKLNDIYDTTDLLSKSSIMDLNPINFNTLNYSRFVEIL